MKWKARPGAVQSERNRTICRAIKEVGRRPERSEERKLSAPAETTPKKLLLQNAVQASVSESEFEASCNNENKEL
uniref:HDC08528 n=1 Tax=Drosophila melanogaster TaxID=7227 RepID=Q6ILS0_DROME|nr:TPA_inf: HDC08528 [Drosophila melanogaster]